jgi:hypothetical protein
MFSKFIDHPFFKELTRGLFGYSGKIDFSRYLDVQVSIKGRSESGVSFAVEELQYIQDNLSDFLGKATEDAFYEYENIKEAVEAGEYDLQAGGGELPIVENSQDIWQHMILDQIVVEPKDKLQIRLGFRSPWDIEHDFGIYITSKKYEYSGTSV